MTLAFEPDEFGESLEAVVNLPGWGSMGGRLDYPRFRHLPQDGSLVITIADEGRGTAPLDEREREVVEGFLADHDRLRRALLEATFARYADLRPEYGAGEDSADDPYAMMPPVAESDGLAPMIRPIRLHLHLRTREGTPYVGIEAQTLWDQEHGLGVLLREDRVVEFGAADVAYETWIVDDDLARHANPAPPAP